MKGSLKVSSILLVFLTATLLTGCQKGKGKEGLRKVKIPQKVEVRKEFKGEKETP